MAQKYFLIAVSELQKLKTNTGYYFTANIEVSVDGNLGIVTKRIVLTENPSKEFINKVHTRERLCLNLEYHKKEDYFHVAK